MQIFKGVTSGQQSSKRTLLDQAEAENNYLRLERFILEPNA
jgi:hypothetical protein